MANFKRIVGLGFIGFLSLSAHAVVPPGPNESQDQLLLPRGTTYFKFGKEVKKALDRDFKESQLIANPRGGRNLTKILSEGGGVYVKLGSKTLNVHIGYKDGQSSGDENSGRSYGAGPMRGGHADDLTYPQLFKMMQDYFDDDTEVRDFYKVFFQILIFCDASGIDQLEPDGQMLMSDLVAIYGAELNRNIMSNLQKHDWQKHLGDVTMLAAFHAATGKVWNADEGRLDEGNLDLFISHGTGGSGVGGRGGIQRRGFQKQLSAALKETQPTIANRIATLIGSKKDLFHDLMEYINQDTIENGNAIIDAYVDLLDVIRKKGSEIEKAFRE